MPTLKCYNCGKKIKYKDLQYVLRIPEINKYAGVCGGCYDKRKGNAKPTEEIRKSEFNGKKLEYGNILDIP